MKLTLCVALAAIVLGLCGEARAQKLFTDISNPAAMAEVMRAFDKCGLAEFLCPNANETMRNGIAALYYLYGVKQGFCGLTMGTGGSCQPLTAGQLEDIFLAFLDTHPGLTGFSTAEVAYVAWRDAGVIVPAVEGKK